MIIVCKSRKVPPVSVFWKYEPLYLDTLISLNVHAVLLWEYEILYLDMMISLNVQAVLLWEHDFVSWHAD